MAHYTRYSGAFLSKAGVAWRVDIWQEHPFEFVPEELRFPADEPVVIEWDTKAKEEVICGSSCTVRLYSPSDRKYIDLYTVTPGEIGVSIYRKGIGASSYSLYWMGALDAEQYEEPYERAWGYEVVLTFQDFGALGRLKYNLEGMQNMAEVLATSLERVGLGDMVHRDLTTRLDYSSFVSSRHIDERYEVSGRVNPNTPEPEIAEDHTPGSESGRLRPIYHYIPDEDPDDGGSVDMNGNQIGPVPAWIGTLAVQSSAFYDDDGEGMALADVVTAMLQPLALKMVQRNGKIWVYDINALTGIGAGNMDPINPDDVNTEGRPKRVTWTSDSQTLGTDKVYNKVKLTFDPKADGMLLNKEAKVDGVDDLAMNTSTDQAAHVRIPHEYTFYSNYQAPKDQTDLSFSIFFGGTGSGLAQTVSSYFNIIGLLGGRDSSGVIGFFRYGHEKLENATTVRVLGNLPGDLSADDIMMRTERVYIPPIAQRPASGHRYMLRLSLDLLADARYNPFEEADDDGNEGANYNSLKMHSAYAMVPCSVRLYDSKISGEIKMHYNNRAVSARYNTGANTKIRLCDSMGSWVTGSDGSNTEGAGCWLSWYDNTAEDSRKTTTGILGWKTNRHTIGMRKGKLMSDVMDIQPGQYIPYPPDGGWLEVIVWPGLCITDSPDDLYDGTGFDNGGESLSHSAIAGRAVSSPQLNWLRWLLYKTPIVEIVWGRGKHDVVSLDEIVTEEACLSGAEDDLEIDLSCGTVGKDVPAARGQIYRVATFLPLRKLTRGGETASPEALLARTLRAQYGGRMTKLSGEAALLADAPHLWTDVNRPGKKMLLLGEVQDLIGDVTDVELSDVNPDSAADRGNVPVAVWFVVSMNLDHVSVAGDAPDRVFVWDAIDMQLVPDEGYRISSVTITVGGEDTEDLYDPETGVIHIENIWGDVVIDAVAEAIYDAKVEYLESDGTAYIDTGIKANQDTIIELEYKCVDASAARIFGARGADYKTNAFMASFVSASDLRTSFNYDNISNVNYLIFSVSVDDGNWHTIKSNGNGHRQIDNITKTGNHSNFTTPYNVILFGYNNNGTIATGKIMIRKCKLNSLDLIPVRKNGVGYLYDKASGALFGNAAESGAFSYGEDV